MHKRGYVTVKASVDIYGNITPLWLEHKGTRYDIDRVLEKPRQAFAKKAGGNGMRYRVRIRGQETYLFQDERQRWFVEEKVVEPFDRSISLPNRHS